MPYSVRAQDSISPWFRPFLTARFNNKHLAEEQAESRQQYDRAMKSDLSLSGRKSEPFWPVQVNPSAMMDR